LFADLSDSSVETVRRLYGENFIVDESLWRGRAPGKPFGIDGKNRPLEFRLLHVVQFADNGDIARENVWIDMAAIIRQLPED
jgi:predicted ester cyclase